MLPDYRSPGQVTAADGRGYNTRLSNREFLE